MKDDTSTIYMPRMAKGALINLSGNCLRTFIIYAYTLLLARILSTSELGQYFLIFTVINIVCLVATVGLDTGVVRYVAIYYGETRYRLIHEVVRAAGIIGMVSGLTMLITVFFSVSIVSRLLFENDSVAVTGLKIFAISIPFWVIARIFNAATQGLHKMQYQVYSRDVGEQTTKILISVLVAISGAGLIGIIWANVIAVIVAAIASVVFTIAILPKSSAKVSESTVQPVKSLVLYSWPFAISNIFGMILIWIDLLLVGYFSSPTDVGYYGAALRVSSISSIILLAFATVLTPVISDLYNRQRMTQLAIIFKTLMRWVFTFSLPIMILLIVMAQPIMRIFGSEFVVGGIVLSILAISQFTQSVMSPAGIIVSMSGRSRMELLNVTVTLIVNVLLCILLIPRYGINGAAMANLAGAVVINLMRNLEALIFVRVHPFSRTLLKPLLAGLLGTCLLVLLRKFFTVETNLLYSNVLLIVFLVSYIGTILAFGLEIQDRELIHLIKARLMGTIKVQMNK